MDLLAFGTVLDYLWLVCEVLYVVCEECFMSDGRKQLGGKFQRARSMRVLLSEM